MTDRPPIKWITTFKGSVESGEARQVIEHQKNGQNQHRLVIDGKPGPAIPREQVAILNGYIGFSDWYGGMIPEVVKIIPIRPDARR